MTNDNAQSQLLEAFKRYRDTVMKDEPDEVRQDALLHFMAGATTVVELVRDAASRGYSAGAAFVQLGSETDSFTQAVIISGALLNETKGTEH